MIICILQKDNTLKIKKRIVQQYQKDWLKADWYGFHAPPRHRLEYETDVTKLTYGDKLSIGFAETRYD